jgi:hypothetical protein
MARINDPVLTYTLLFYAYATAKNGRGRRAWRLCSASKVIAPNRLLRITPKGEILEIGGFYSFVSMGGVDDLLRMTILTRITFYYADKKDSPRQTIRGVPCYPGEAESLLDHLREYGFEVSISRPAKQEPTSS